LFSDDIDVLDAFLPGIHRTDPTIDKTIIAKHTPIPENVPAFSPHANSLSPAFGESNENRYKS
jgi:hypothetical protein